MFGDGRGRVPVGGAETPTITPMGHDSLADRPLTEPHPSRFDACRPDSEAILVAHAAAIALGDAGYVDPSSGLFVFTAAWLAERRSCCDTGCRHCPYVL